VLEAEPEATAQQFTPRCLLLKTAARRFSREKSVFGDLLIPSAAGTPDFQQALRV
jgi:hypothetical protein